MKGLRLQPTDIRLAAIFLILALLAALITWLFAPARTEGSAQKQPSTFFNTGYGTKAFYLSLGELGYDTRRLRQRLTWDDLYDLDGLVILEPIVEIDPLEREDVLDWVYMGGTLILAPGAAGPIEIGIPFVPEDELANDQATRRAGSVSESLDAVDASAWVHSVFDPQRPVDELLVGVDQLELGESMDRLDVLKGAVLQAEVGPLERVHGDHVGAYIVRVYCGEGQIILLADVYPLTNLGISKKDNAVLAANLAMAMVGGDFETFEQVGEPATRDDEPGQSWPGVQSEVDAASPAVGEDGEAVARWRPDAQWLGTIGFDEYHLGFGQRDTTAIAMAKLVWEGPYAWAVTQAVVVGLVALFAGAWRFGRPRDLPPIRRRHRADFARAAGHLLREARQGTGRLAILADHHRAKWCKAVHLPTHATDEVLANAVQQRCDERVLPLLEAAGRLRMQDALNDLELLSLAQALHRVTEVLEHGTASRR